MERDSDFKNHPIINSMVNHSKLHINLNHCGVDKKLNTALGSFH